MAATDSCLSGKSSTAFLFGSQAASPDDAGGVIRRLDRCAEESPCGLRSGFQKEEGSQMYRCNDNLEEKKRHCGIVLEGESKYANSSIHRGTMDATCGSPFSDWNFRWGSSSFVRRATVILLLLFVVNCSVVRASTKTVYFSTGNKTVATYVGPSMAFGDPPAQAFLVSDGNPGGLPADDPMTLGGAAEQWLSSGLSSNGTRFGPTLRGLAVFGIRGTPLDVGTYDAVTITFFMSVHSAAARGLLFAIIENVWEGNRTHPIADELSDDASSEGEGVVGVFAALRLGGNGTVEYTSSETGGRRTIVKGSDEMWDGQWHHVAVVINWDGSYMQLFVDAHTSYSAVEWFGCISGEAPAMPEAVSPNVLSRFSGAPGTVVLDGGAAVFGYGGDEVSLGVFQVHEGVMTETEIAAISGHMDHVSVKPSIGLAIGAVLVVVCLSAAGLTAYTTKNELQSGEAEPEKKPTLAEVSAPQAGPRKAWIDGEKKVTIVDALAEGSGMAGQAATSLGRAADSISLVMRMSKMGSVASVGESLVQKLVVIVPMALAPLQGLSLYIRGWEWPTEFVAAVEYLAIPITIDLPFVFPTVPPYIFLVLKFVVAMTIFVAVLRFIAKRDAATFDDVLLQYRAVQDMYCDTIRMELCEGLGAGPDDTRNSSIIELSQTIAAASRQSWDADDVKRIANLCNADAETVAQQLRFLSPPETMHEAAVQYIAVSGNIEAADKATLLARCRDVASALVGTGRGIPCGIVVGVVGGITLEDNVQEMLAEQLLRVGGAMIGVKNALSDKSRAPIEEILSRVLEYCKANKIIVPQTSMMAECILREKMWPDAMIERGAKPPLAPSGSTTPAELYKVMLRIETTGVTYDCWGPGRDALLQTANAVCRFRGLDRVFVHFFIDVLRSGASAEESERIQNCYVEAKWEGTAVQLTLTAENPAQSYSVRILNEKKMICPSHLGWLMEAQAEHFAVRTTNPLPSMPYKCVHSTNEAFKACEASRNEEVVRPCAEDVLYVCPVRTCCVTVCGHCARLTFKETLRTSIITTINTMGSVDFHRILFIIVLAMMFPLTQDGIMVLACHPSVRCVFGINDEGGCYGRGASTSFLISAIIGALSLVVYRILMVVWLCVELQGRKRRVDEAVRTQWKGAQHPEWNRFLESDATVLSGLYRKYELPHFLSEQPWLLLAQVAICLAVALTDPNSLLQLIAASCVELGSLAYLMLTDPFIDVWQDLLAKAAAVHQLLQLALMFFHRAAAAQSPLGSSGKVVVAMLLVAAAYVAFFIFVLWKRVIVPLLDSHRATTAEALLRQQRLILKMGDAMQASFLMEELAAEFREAFGVHHFLTAVAEAHVFALCEAASAGEDSKDEGKKVVTISGGGNDNRSRCIDALSRVDASEHLGIRWRPLGDIDEHARTHISKVLDATMIHEDGKGKSEIEKIARRLEKSLKWCRGQRDSSSYAVGNILTLVAVLRGKEPACNWDFSGLHIRGADVSGAVLKEVTFESSSIWDSAFHKTTSIRVNYKGAQLRNVEWRRRAKAALCVLRSRGDRFSIKSAVFSPDSTKIAIVHPSDVKVWDVETARPIAILKCNSHPISAAFSPDSKRIVSTSGDKKVRVWDTETGEQLAELEGHRKDVTGASFSRNAYEIVSASSDHTVKVWDARTMKEITTFEGHTKKVNCASFAADSKKIVSASDDNTVRVWNVSSNEQIAVMIGHTDDVLSASFSPDSTKIVSASEDKTVRLWDAATGQQLAELIGHTSDVKSAVFSPDSTKIVSASNDHTVRIWDAVMGQQLAELKGHTEKVKCAEFSPDSTKIVSASEDKTVRIWDAATGQQLAELKGHRKRVTDASFSPDSTMIVSASEDKTVRIWDAAAGQPVAEPPKNTFSLKCAAFSPDSTKIVTGGGDRTLIVWDALTGQSIVELKGHKRRIMCAAFSPDATKIVSGSMDQTLRLWDVAGASCIWETEPDGHDVNGVAFSPDSTKIVSASCGRTVKIWDAATGKLLAELKGHHHRVMSVACSPDSTKIVSTSSDESVRIWDIATEKQIGKLKGHRKTVTDASFSPDGTKIVSASEDRTVRIWDVATKEETAQLKAHTDCVNCASFSLDGTKIVSASDDETVKVWDVAKQEEILRLKGHSDGINCAAFSPDSTMIVSASEDKTVRLWKIVPPARSSTADEAPKSSAAVFCATVSTEGQCVVSRCSFSRWNQQEIWCSNAPLYFVDCIDA